MDIQDESLQKQTEPEFKHELIIISFTAVTEFHSLRTSANIPPLLMFTSQHSFSKYS